MKTIFYNKYFSILLPILVWQLYAYSGIPTIFCKISGFLASFFLLVVTFRSICKSLSFNSKLENYVGWILFSMFLTFVMAYLFWNQRITSSFRAAFSAMSLSYFFYLRQGNFSKKSVVFIITVLGILNVILWGYALSVSPKIIFGFIGKDDSDMYVMNRGIARIELNGSNFQVLLYFYCLANCFLKMQKIKWGVLTFILFVVCSSSMTRFKIISIVLVSLYWIFFKNRLSFKSIILISVVLGIFIIGVLTYFSSYLEILAELTTEQFSGRLSESSDGLYRLKEYGFFIFDFQNNVITRLFGNGFVGDSNLGSYVNKMKMMGFYPDDVSYAFVYVQMGLLGLFLYLKLLLKCCRLNVSKDVVFAQLMILYIAVSSITLMNVFDSITFATCLYLLWLDIKQKKRKYPLNSVLPA